MRKTGHRALKLFLGALLLLFALSAIIPFVIMLLFSLTQKTDLTLVFRLDDFSLKNYITIFTGTKIARYFLNSVIVVVGSCFFNCVISAMAAYAFAKKSFPGRDKLFFVYLATMMIPAQVTLIPVFVIFQKLGLINTYTAMIIPFVNAFGVFLIRQFMLNVPDELLEAARIDGCGELQMFTRIVLPLIKPVLISLTIFTFITSWSNYLWPLVLTSTDTMQTLTLAVANMQGQNVINYGLVMAGATLSFLPPFILYVILQRQFVEGIALSGIKG